MVTVLPVLISPLAILPVVDQTVVGAIPTLTIKMEPSVRDVPILEMTHSTVKINMILIAAQLGGSATQSTRDASLESQVRDTILTALATFSARAHQFTQNNINATLPHIHVKNANQVKKNVMQTEMLLVETAGLLQETNSSVIKLIQKSQNATSVQRVNKKVAKTTLLLAKHAFPQP